MKLTKLSILAILSILIMANGAATSAVVSIDQTGNFEFENDLVEIKVTGNGNVPKYTVTLLETGDSYDLFFNSIFTVVDSDTDGVYDSDVDQSISRNDGGFSKSLPSSSWDFSEVTNRTDGGAEFDISSVGLGQRGGNSPNPYADAVVTLKNRITGGAATEIKFDVVMDGFDFSNAPEDTLLVFSYTISSNGDAESSQDGNQVNIGDNGYFSSVPTAEDDNGQFDVGMSSTSDENGTRIYISYPAFEGEMVHDPTMGVQASSSGGDDSDENGPELANEDEAPLSFAFGAIGLLVIPILNRRKQN